VYTEEDIRPEYKFVETRSVTWRGETYLVKKVDTSQSVKPVPRNEENTILNPAIWEGRLKDAPVNFHSKKNGETVINLSKASAQLYEEWGEGIYQVLRYPDKKVHHITNLYEQHLITKKED